MIAEAEICRIIKYLKIRPDVELSEVRRKMFNPRGLTFNSPGIAKWKKGFNQEQIEKLNEALSGELSCGGHEV